MHELYRQVQLLYAFINIEMFSFRNLSAGLSLFIKCYIQDVLCTFIYDFCVFLYYVFAVTYMGLEK